MPCLFVHKEVHSLVSFNYQRLCHRTSDELLLCLTNSYESIELFTCEYDIAVDYDSGLKHKRLLGTQLIGTLFEAGMTQALLHGSRTRKKESKVDAAMSRLATFNPLDVASHPVTSKTTSKSRSRASGGAVAKAVTSSSSLPMPLADATAPASVLDNEDLVF